MAAGYSVAPGRWQAGLDELLGRVAGRFPRVESRQRARALVLGLLAELPRKNCWTIAEHAGDPSPDGLQHLLARAMWDHDGSAMTCAPTWSSTWARTPQCWSSTRPGT